MYGIVASLLFKLHISHKVEWDNALCVYLVSAVVGSYLTANNIWVVLNSLR